MSYHQPEPIRTARLAVFLVDLEEGYYKYISGMGQFLIRREEDWTRDYFRMYPDGRVFNAQN